MTGGRRTAAVSLAAVVLVVVLAAVLVVWRGDGDGDDATESTLGALDLAGLDEGSRELVLLARDGAGVAHQATYEQSDGTTFEIWMDGDEVREEVTPTDGPRRLVLETGDGVLRCTADDSGWSCDDRTEPVDGSRQEGLQRRVDQLLVELAGASVDATDDDVAGEAVRCFAIIAPGDEVEVCLTADGLLTRLVAGDEQLELTGVDRDVDRQAFEGPA